jgi:hypothetical protein
MTSSEDPTLGRRRGKQDYSERSTKKMGGKCCPRQAGTDDFPKARPPFCVNIDEGPTKNGQRFARSGGDPMDFQILLFSGAMVALLIVVVGVAVALEYKRATRRRELEHVERMKAIECGYPLPDESSARHKLLGAIGVIVPAASLAAAAWSTQLILGREDYGAPRWLLPVIWGVSGVVALVVGVVSAASLGPRKVVWPGGVKKPQTLDPSVRP